MAMAAGSVMFSPSSPAHRETGKRKRCVLLLSEEETPSKRNKWSSLLDEEDLYPRKATTTEGGGISKEEVQQLALLAASMLSTEESSNDDFESTKVPSYPDLPAEPKDALICCRVGVRLPDGRRVRRSFLCSDSIRLLWSFCRSLLEEAGSRNFRLLLSIPGESTIFENTVNGDPRWCCTYLLVPSPSDPLFVEIGDAFIRQQMEGGREY